LRAVGTEVQGGLSALLAAADLVVDCGPSRTGAGRAELYRRHRVPAVFCGGERDRGLGPLVHSGLNPNAARQPGDLRLLSCNTTALARVVAGIGPDRIESVDATVLRCSTDTDKAAKGITNGAVLAPSPSHHGADLAQVTPHPPVRTVSATVPMTAGHCIHARIALRGLAPSEALDRLAGCPRIELLAAGVPAYTAELKRRSSARWQDRHRLQVLPIGSSGVGVLELWLALDNQAITIPEVLDVIQLATGTAAAGQAQARSDRMLGIRTAREDGSR
jgi:glyceraldehyde-3-phosphate dehydrogenase (NAD(P))